MGWEVAKYSELVRGGPVFLRPRTFLPLTWYFLEAPGPHVPIAYFVVIESMLELSLLLDLELRT